MISLHFEMEEVTFKVFAFSRVGCEMLRLVDTVAPPEYIREFGAFLREQFAETSIIIGDVISISDNGLVRFDNSRDLDVELRTDNG
jgi:hypothetical protein